MVAIASLYESRFQVDPKQHAVTAKNDEEKAKQSNIGIFANFTKEEVAISIARSMLRTPNFQYQNLI